MEGVRLQRGCGIDRIYKILGGVDRQRRGYRLRASGGPPRQGLVPGVFSVEPVRPPGPAATVIRSLVTPAPRKWLG